MTLDDEARRVLAELVGAGYRDIFVIDSRSWLERPGWRRSVPQEEVRTVSAHALTPDGMSVIIESRRVAPDGTSKLNVIPTLPEQYELALAVRGPPHDTPQYRAELAAAAADAKATEAWRAEVQATFDAIRPRCPLCTTPMVHCPGMGPPGFWTCGKCGGFHVFDGDRLEDVQYLISLGAQTGPVDHRADVFEALTRRR